MERFGHLHAFDRDAGRYLPTTSGTRSIEARVNLLPVLRRSVASCLAEISREGPTA